MLIIKGDKITKDGANLLRVWQVINDPTEQEKVGAYEIESIPEYPKQKRGKSSIMYYNIDSKEFLFEEEDRPLTPEETAEETRELLVDISDPSILTQGAGLADITGVTAGTSYRVRAYAVNSAGTGYGTTVDVKTLSSFIPRTMWFN